MNPRLQMTAPVWIALVAYPFLLASCVATTEGTVDENPRVISQKEIQDLGPGGNAYTLVQHYNPRWLETRGQGSINSPSEVAVYIDEHKQGGPSALRQVSTTDVQKIEFLPPDQATMEYGSGHENGAIMVYLKTGRTPRSR